MTCNARSCDASRDSASRNRQAFENAGEIAIRQADQKSVSHAAGLDVIDRARGAETSDRATPLALAAGEAPAPGNRAPFFYRVKHAHVSDVCRLGTGKTENLKISDHRVRGAGAPSAGCGRV